MIRWQHTYDDCKAAYLGCYRDLTSGSPDGWMVRGTQDHNMHWRQIYANMVDAVGNYSGDDWQVVPVRLIKIEGE